MANIDIHIDDADNIKIIADNQYARGKLDFDKKKVFDLLDDIERRENSREEIIKELGKYLVHSLFTTERYPGYKSSISEVFNKHYTRLIEHEGEDHMRLVFRIDPANMAAQRLPWEFLNDGEHFLIHRDVSILRIPQDIPHDSPRKIDDKLRLLIIVSADEEDLPHASSEKANIVKLFETKLKDMVDIKVLSTEDQSDRKPTLTNIAEELEKGFHILHFIGHSDFDVEGKIFLPDESGDILGYREDDFSRIFVNTKVTKRLALITLNSCKSGREKGYNGLARKLIDKSIPCVIAMQYRILDRNGPRFANIFYERFLDNEHKFNPEYAINSCRREFFAIRADHISREFAAPVLYLATENEAIIEYSDKQELIIRKESHRHVDDLLPPQAEPLVYKGEKKLVLGREKKISEIGEIMKSPGSYVCVIGPGGSGKSQLAFKAIHQYVKENVFDFVIPIYFSGGLINYEEFLSRVSERLFQSNPTYKPEFDKQKAKGNLERCVEIVRVLLSEKRHPLIYLDNYETISHIINTSRESSGYDDAKKISEFLNNNIPENTSILVTSQERNNNLVNEISVDLEGLDEENGIRLFIAFARDKYLKNPSGNIRKKINNILRKIGYHPLTIEIIAKNVRNVQELDEMSQSLGTREVDQHASEERFRSLTDCFGYTINRLDSKLKELLYKLTLFKSPFPATAPEYVFGNASRKDDVFTVYEKSLLQRIESDDLYGEIENPDYFLYTVHPSVRNYLENSIEILNESYSDLDEEYGERFSDYYHHKILDEVYNLMGDADLHVPLLARFNVIFNQGANNDFHRSVLLTRNYEYKHRILSLLAAICRTLGLFYEATRYSEAALGIAKKRYAKDPRPENVDAIIESYHHMGLSFWDIGMLDEALAYNKKALKIERSLDNKAGIADCYRNIGLVLHFKGKIDEALRYHRRALKIEQKLADTRDKNITRAIASNYRNMAHACSQIGRLDQALDFHKKSFEINKGLDRLDEAMDYINTAEVLIEIGRLDQALEYLDESLRINQFLKNPVRIAASYTGLGRLYRQTGRLDQALDFHKKSLEINQKYNYLGGIILDYELLGIVFDNIGRFDQALEFLRMALDINEKLDNTLEIANVCRELSIVFDNIGRFDQALEFLDRAFRIHKDLKLDVHMAKDNYIRSLELSRTDKEKALEYNSEALNIMQNFESTTGYHHVLIDRIRRQISLGLS